MPAVLEMLRGVFVLRGIAAAHVPAYHAHTQVNPGVSDFHAFRTNTDVGSSDLNLIQMLAFL
jgi:peptidoglycan/LPS O-acetylase OafA/YrhL